MRGKLPPLAVPDEDGKSRRRPGRVGLSVDGALDLGEIADDKGAVGPRRPKPGDLELIDCRQVREVLLFLGAASIGALDLKPRCEKALQPSAILVCKENEEPVHQLSR